MPGLRSRLSVAANWWSAGAGTPSARAEIVSTDPDPRVAFTTMSASVMVSSSDLTAKSALFDGPGLREPSVTWWDLLHAVPRVVATWPVPRMPSFI
jgi:hypothetical protein